MKKILLWMLVMVMLLGVLSGCGSDKKDKEQNNTGSAEQTENSERINVADLNASSYVELGEYLNLAVTVAAAEEVTDAQVEEQALLFYQDAATADNGGVTDRAVATGDTVIMDYVGKRDGVAFDGGTAQNASLTIGSGQFIDGFEDGLIGVMPGETVDLNLTFPEEYHSADLAGAKVVFTVTVHYIVPTEMKDEVVAGMGVSEYQNVEQLKAYVRTVLEENEQYYYEQNVQSALMNVLLANSTYKELPEEYMNQCNEELTANIQANAAMYGLDANTYLYYMAGTDLTTYLQEVGPSFAKQMLTLQAIAEKEGLTVTDEALDEYIEEIVRDGGWESKEQFLSQYDKEDVRESLMSQNVLEFMAANAIVTNE